MNNLLWLAVAILASAFAVTAPAKTNDLGLTSNHVYGLWDSINALVPCIAHIESDSASVMSSVTNMKPAQFRDKKPADVLQLASELTFNVNKLLRKYDLQVIFADKQAELKSVTPSDVFLHSG